MTFDDIYQARHWFNKYEDIKNLIETGDFGKEEELYLMLKDVPLDYLELPENGSSLEDRTAFIDMFTVVSPTEITWLYKGNEDQGEYRNDSGFTIRKTTQSEVNYVKHTNYTETD